MIVRVQTCVIVETIINYHQLSWPFERAFKIQWSSYIFLTWIGGSFSHNSWNLNNMCTKETGQFCLNNISEMTWLFIGPYLNILYKFLQAPEMPTGTILYYWTQESYHGRKISIRRTILTRKQEIWFRKLFTVSWEAGERWRCDEGAPFSQMWPGI